MRVRRYRRVWRICCATALGVTAMCLGPSAAAAAERVQDGGFEASTCDAMQCTNPVWQDSATSAFASGTGPICRSGTGSGNTACNGGGGAPFSGSTWARLGAGHKGTDMFDGGIVSSLEQIVPIPTTQAALRFRLRIIDSAVATGQFTVEVGGTEVFSVTDATGGYGAYAPVAIDLSAHAGTAPLIRFEGFSTRLSIGVLDSFDIDDVTTVDPRCAPLRAKLKKTKKTKKKKRRKLRRKLRKLGC
jgi:hypothetical protein